MFGVQNTSEQKHIWIKQLHKNVLSVPAIRLKVFPYFFPYGDDKGWLSVVKPAAGLLGNQAALVSQTKQWLKKTNC